METILSSLSALTGGLLKVSAQAALVIGLVLLVQWLFQRSLSLRWRYALWLLVLARLLLPVSLESGISIFNFTTIPPAEVFRAVGAASNASAAKVEAKNAPVPAAPAASVPAPTAAAGNSAAAVSLNPPAESKPAPPSATIPGTTRVPRRAPLASGKPFPWAATLSLVWLAGVLFLVARLIWFPLRLNAQLARHETPTSPAVFEILDEAKRLIGVNRVLPIVQSRAVQSPALLGFIRPWLLLPEGLVEKFSAEELRFVFLHELAHLKRRDIAVNWLMTLLQILHWFNPLVWFAFARMRADRELACDELALSFAQAGENKSYGRAIIKLLEGFTRPAVLPGLVGILEDEQQMKRRIIMIAQFKQMTRWSTAAASLLFVLGALTLTDAQSDPTFATANSPSITTRRVLADTPFYEGNLTADGKYIRSLDRQTGDLLQFEVASGQMSRIKNQGPWTDQDKGLEGQILSPDGQQIAYTSFRPARLQVRNLDGSVVRTLCSGKGASVWALDWSPGGESIVAYRMRDQTRELTLVSVADGSMHALRPVAAHYYSFDGARFSPDGRYIAFSLVREGSRTHGDVFLMTADGRDETVVAGHPAEDRLIGWSPDGSRLIFRSDRSGTWDLWTVLIADGKQQGKPTLLKRDFGSEPNINTVGIAPDGSCFYTIFTMVGGLYRGEVDRATGSVLSPPTPVALRYNGFVSMLSWAPDGRHLLYVSNRADIGPGKNILTIRAAVSDQERFLMPDLRFVNQISWAPDGRSILALGMTEKGGGIFRIDAETSGITQLLDHGMVPRLCPDGTTLVFEYGGIRKRNLETGKEWEVIKAGAFNYDLSPDGREVAYEQDGVVKAVSLAGGEPRELARGLGKSLQVKWTGDGRHLVAYARKASKGIIWLVPAHGGTPVKLDLAMPKMEFFALHPDNRRFVCSVKEESKSELWVLENFLPTEKLAAK